MKRLHVPVILALAALVALPAAGRAAPPTDPVRGPSCGNIEIFDLAYRRAADGTPTVAASFAVEGNVSPCASLTYTFYVLTSDGQTQLATSSGLGDLAVRIPGGPSEVCVYAESRRGTHVIDRAPNEGCGLLVLDGGSGATSFR